MLMLLSLLCETALAEDGSAVEAAPAEADPVEAAPFAVEIELVPNVQVWNARSNLFTPGLMLGSSAWALGRELSWRRMRDSDCRGWQQ